MNSFFTKNRILLSIMSIPYIPVFIDTISPSYFYEITLNIDDKYKINNTMAYRGLIGSIFGIIFYYPFGSFYHDMNFTHYNEEKNYVSLSLMRFGLWGHLYMGSIQYEIYDDTHYIFKECKKQYDAREHFRKTCKQSPFCSLAFNN